MKYSYLVRLFLSLCSVFVVAWGVSAFLAHGRMANDFSWLYGGALDWRNGLDPYNGPSRYVNANWMYTPDPLYYPLPAVMVAVPFSYLSPQMAGLVFASLSAFVLTWALTSTGEYWRLMALFSAPAWIAFGNVQWSPLLLASMYLGWLSWLQCCKPSLGFAAWVGKPRLFSVVVSALLIIGSLVVFPGWLAGWLHNIAFQSHHDIPMFRFAPGLLALSLLAWRTNEGRFFFAWSLVPQMVFFYDALLLWFVPRKRWQMCVLTLSSWLGVLQVGIPDNRVDGLEYLYMVLPALCIVLYNVDWGTIVPGYFVKLVPKIVPSTP